MVSYDTQFAMLFADSIASTWSRSEAPVMAGRLVTVRAGRSELEQMIITHKSSANCCGAAILLAMHNETLGRSIEPLPWP